MQNIPEEKLSKWMAPIWKRESIWEEPVCFFEDAQGAVQGGKLLYAPEKITSIVNYDATVVYEEHRDYEVTEEGICLPVGSRIPVLKREDYISKYEGQSDAEWLCLPEKKEFVNIFPEIHQYQVLVSYEANGETSVWTGSMPEKQGGKLVNTYKKLENGEPLHVVFYGDSITAGWEASGADELAVDMYTLAPTKIEFQRYPHMPVWAELVAEQLRGKYPAAAITKDNLSAGGSTAQWGLEHVNELFDRVATPDLVFIGFGMNCMWDEPEIFINAIKGIRDEICKRNPDCEFVLYPAMVANPEMSVYQHENMQTYEAALEVFAKELPGVITAPVHSMFKELGNRGKEYYEISGNAVNHPNDFSIRLYGQTIWETMNK